jgi:hypothetical protein
MIINASIAYWVINTNYQWWMKVLHCDLKWVNEVYPFKKCIAKSFQKCVEIPFNFKCIDFCNISLMIIIAFHNIFMIFSSEQYQRGSDLAKK